MWAGLPRQFRQGLRRTPMGGLQLAMAAKVYGVRPAPFATACRAYGEGRRNVRRQGGDGYQPPQQSQSQSQSQPQPQPQGYDYQSYYEPPESTAPPTFAGAPGIISQSDPVARILNQPTLVIQRQIEYMNLFLGFEQANRYSVMDAMGNQLGWLVERDYGIAKVMLRQLYGLHRPFVVDLFDNEGNVLLTARRRFAVINSHIKTLLPNVRNESGEQDPDGAIIGESVQSWHLWRRRYDLFQNDQVYAGGPGETMEQFGKIDSGFLSWDFPVFNEQGQVAGAVSRNFGGLMREMFTDTGVYVVRMTPQSFQGLEEYYGTVAPEPLTLDQRAVMLANAVSVDFDYFSRHSRGHSPFFFVGGGDDV